MDVQVRARGSHRTRGGECCAVPQPAAHHGDPRRRRLIAADTGSWNPRFIFQPGSDAGIDCGSLNDRSGSKPTSPLRLGGPLFPYADISVAKPWRRSTRGRAAGHRALGGKRLPTAMTRPRRFSQGLPLIIGQRLCCCGTADRGVWTPTVEAAASHRGEVSCAVPPSEDIDLK
jgi:hypothetical protein